MQRKILAVVAGTLAAVILIIAIESLGHAVYPVPDDIDFTDRAAVRAYTDSLPLGALLFVMAAWLLATFGGGVLASAIARKRPLVYCAITGGLVLVGTIMNLLSIPHPLWFSLVSVAGIVACVFLAARVARALPGARGSH